VTAKGQQVPGNCEKGTERERGSRSLVLTILPHTIPTNQQTKPIWILKMKHQKLLMELKTYQTCYSRSNQGHKLLSRSRQPWRKLLILTPFLQGRQKKEATKTTTKRVGSSARVVYSSSSFVVRVGRTKRSYVYVFKIKIAIGLGKRTSTTITLFAAISQ